jgi:hypothetical protein
MSSLLRWAPLAALVLFLGAYLAHVDSPQARYQHLKALYPLVYGRVGAVDLATVGPSGTQVMVDAHEFSRLLTERYGRPTIVVDVSRSWFGPNTDYVLLRDLAEQQHVRHFVIQFRRYAGASYPEFHEHGRFGDIIRDGLAHRELHPWERARLALHGCIRKVAQNAVLHLTGKFDDHESISISPTKTDDAFAIPNPKVPEKIDELASKFGKSWRTKTEQWSLEDPKDAHARYYYDRVVDLGRSTHAEVTFFFVNTLFSPPLDESFRRRAERRYGVGILALGTYDLAALYPAGYADHGHSTKFGQVTQARAFTAKLDLK